MRTNQSPSLFITVVVLICSTALLLQCTEGETKVRDVLASQLKSCKYREGNVVSSCRFLLNNTVQASDSSLKSCCQTVGQAKFGQDCLCLIQESERATPSSNSPESETLKVLEAVSSNKQFISSCAALNGVEENCSGVAKALKRAAEVKEMTLKEVSAASPHCDRDALKLRDVCGPTIAKAQNGTKINSKRAQSIVCCNELENFIMWGCGCSLGSTVPTSQDILDFLADVSTVSDKLSKACSHRGFRANIREYCPKPTNQDNKKPLLFDKCETTAQEAVKTCTPMINEAMASFNNTKPISDADLLTIICCDNKLLQGEDPYTMFDEDQPSSSCVCNKTIYEEYQMALEADKVSSKSASTNPQTVSCCNQLSKLIESPPQSCLCNLTHHKTVTSRATTTDFLTSDIIHRAVDKNCDPKISLSNYKCVVQTPYVDTPSNPDSFWAILARSFKKGTLFSDKGLCYPGVSGPRGC